MQSLRPRLVPLFGLGVYAVEAGELMSSILEASEGSRSTIESVAPSQVGRGFADVRDRSPDLSQLQG